MGKACRQLKDGMDVSGHPRLNEAGTVVVVFDDGTEWLPPLIPPDLTKFAAAGGSVPNKVVKAKAKQAASKPVEDYVLETIRAKFSKQGKSSPIIKVEARVDRHDLSSAWRQKMQIVVKSEGGMTPTVAMNHLHDLLRLLSQHEFKSWPFELQGVQGQLDPHAPGWHPQLCRLEDGMAACVQADEEGFPAAADDPLTSVNVTFGLGALLLLHIGYSLVPKP